MLNSPLKQRFLDLFQRGSSTFSGQQDPTQINPNDIFGEIRKAQEERQRRFGSVYTPEMQGFMRGPLFGGNLY